MPLNRRLYFLVTTYIRQERFNNGLWAKVVEEMMFLRILYRIKELLINNLK